MRVAIVGSGPAGMYAAAFLAEDERVAGVDVLDERPSPFGLVRHGVAPDHHKATSVAAVFARTLSLPQVRFFGNVDVGTDVSRAELLERYDLVIYAVGVDHDRELGIPGVVGALEMVDWYTGVPGARPFDLTGVTSAVVVGGGNVALDIARLLLLDREGLRGSTMPESALAAFEKAQVEQVHIVIRRTAVDVKFSIPELREILALPGVSIELDPDELPDPPTGETGIAARHTAKRLDLFRASADRAMADSPRLVFHFGSQVSEAIPGEGRLLELVTLTRSGREALALPAQLVVSAIGFTGTRVPDVPYDETAHIVPNEDGLVTGNDPLVRGREFVVGWAGRGPTGVIGTNKGDAASTVATLWESVTANGTPWRPLPDVDNLANLLRARGIEVVDTEGWQRIDEAERALGSERKAPSVRINDLDELLRHARDE